MHIHPNLFQNQFKQKAYYQTKLVITHQLWKNIMRLRNNCEMLSGGTMEFERKKTTTKGGAH